ncbi:baseplate J/gp47 family protein [Sporosarcina sp. ITBMC105]
MEEFLLPEHLRATEEETHEAMIRMAPPNIDTSEGGMYWDHTKPTAMVKSRLVEYELTLTVMMMFPQFATGKYLEWHGEPIGVVRKPASHSIGHVTFVGTNGTTIPRGTVVMTAGGEDEEAQRFVTADEGVIDVSGSVILPITSLSTGVIANVPAGSIRYLESGIEGISDLINNEPTKDGLDSESDESLRGRILQRNQNKPLSGSRGDYERWAKEVPGVGDATAIPLWDGEGTVKVLVTDSENRIASPELITAVKNYIDPIDGMGEGVAPIGSIVTVDTLTPILLYLKMSLTVAEGFETLKVLDDVKSNINKYLADKLLVQYAKVGSLIINTNGVSDYDNLLINSNTENIPLKIGERAIVESIEVIGSAS